MMKKIFLAAFGYQRLPLLTIRYRLVTELVTDWSPIGAGAAHPFSKRTSATGARELDLMKSSGFLFCGFSAWRRRGWRNCSNSCFMPVEIPIVTAQVNRYFDLFLRGNIELK